LLTVLLACAEPEASSDGAKSPDQTAPIVDTGPVCSEDELGETYERYVEPVMTDAHPSSCNECHLAGVDLSMYVRGTPCQSMACMVAEGVVDLEDPAASQVLAFITQGEPASELIDDEVRQREYDGMMEWIEWAAVCQEDVCGTYDDPCQAGDGASPVPDDVASPLGVCSEDELTEVFEEKVWSWMGRCESCHWSGGAGRADNADAPAFVTSIADDDWVAGTMYSLIGIGAIDLDDPATSLLMTKPLEEGATVQTELGAVTGVFHGGGDKIHVEDGEAEDTLYDFVDFVVQYAACMG
jgi:hypothetical protein